MIGKHTREEMECSCSLGYDCERHQMTTEKRLQMLDDAIFRTKKIMDGDSNISFTSEEYITFYTCAFSLSNFNRYGSRANQLYEKFVNAFRESMVSVVLPALDNKENVPLLTEFFEMLTKYKAMSRRLSSLFSPLNNYCLLITGSPINEAPIHLFCDSVSDSMWTKLQNAVIYLLNLERAEKLTDNELLKSAIDFFREIENKGRRNHYRYFEEAIIADTAARYSTLTSKWLLNCSFGTYIRKVEWSLNKEERIMSPYFRETTVNRLLMVVRVVLLNLSKKSFAELICRHL